MWIFLTFCFTQKFPYISQTCYHRHWGNYRYSVYSRVLLWNNYYKEAMLPLLWAKNRKKMIEKQDSIKNQSIDSHATFSKTFINNTSAFTGSIINKLDWEQGHIGGWERVMTSQLIFQQKIYTFTIIIIIIILEVSMLGWSMRNIFLRVDISQECVNTTILEENTFEFSRKLDLLTFNVSVSSTRTLMYKYLTIKSPTV